MDENDFPGQPSTPEVIADFTLGPHSRHLIFSRRCGRNWSARLCIKNPFPNELLRFKIKTSQPNSFRMIPPEGAVKPGQPPVNIFFEYTPTGRERRPGERHELFSIILCRETLQGQIIRKEEQKMCSLFIDDNEFIRNNDDDDDDCDDDECDDDDEVCCYDMSDEKDVATNHNVMLVGGLLLLGLLLVLLLYDHDAPMASGFFSSGDSC